MGNKYILLIAALFVIVSCGKQAEDMTPVQPGETEVFKDQVYKFSFKAPKNWVVESSPGLRTIYYSTQASQTRFQKFTEGDMGAKIEVGVKSPSTTEQSVADFRDALEGVTYSEPEQTTLGGAPAMKITFHQGDEDDAYIGYRIFAQKDSVVTYFEAATFGKQRMAKYKPVFDMAEGSVTLGYVLKLTGKLDSSTIATLKEEAKPSDRLSTYNGSGWTMQYPDNFNVRVTGKNITFEGAWKGATIVVDMFDMPEGNDLAKFADENSKKTYKGAPVSNGTVSGKQAKVINYSMVAGVGSRAYFVANGGKVYRITINWPKELESSFLSSFEKSVNTFTIK
jgi:hypothetical protein